MATHSTNLALKPSMGRGAWHATVLKFQRVRHDLATEQQQYL